ncbi:MAG: tetratricopeptide repeat protein, partial [Planctomycetes bacterium]|nr:tetratricopeptide repeat protein [Planctomycetota bacterium]
MKRAKREKKTRCRGKSVERDPLPERRRLALWKKAAFALVVLCLFFMGVEWVLLLAGVRPMLYEEDPYVGFSSTIPLFVEERNDEGQVIMVTAQNKVNLFNVQRFARDKAEGVYRIFCLGGSTTYGRPYTDTSSFCGWLRELLPKADPSRQWELINAGGISYASYRVALLMEELIAYQPDMFVIYTGQNEFLEKRTYGELMEKIGLVKSAEALLGRTRLYSLIRRSIKGRVSQSGAETNVLEILPAEVETILERSVGPESYVRDEGFRRGVIEHYRFNIERMIKIADSVGVAVVLVTPASNLRDSSPFKSQHRVGLSKAQRRRWEELFARGSRLQGSGQWAKALSALEEATAIDDRYAHLHYARGRTLWQMERFTEAKKAFVRALDEDVCPLRALPEMVSIVAETGRGHGAIVVDFAALAAAQSPHGTAGENLFLDHVHPTIRGSRMLALSIMDTLIEEEIVRPSPTWSEEMVDAVSQEVESQLDQRAHEEALLNLAWVLGWAGKYEESYKLALQAVEMIPGNAQALIKVAASAEQLGLIDEAVAYNQKTLAVKPDYTEAYVNLGNI